MPFIKYFPQQPYAFDKKEFGKLCYSYMVTYLSSLLCGGKYSANLQQLHTIVFGNFTNVVASKKQLLNISQISLLIHVTMLTLIEE